MNAADRILPLDETVTPSDEAGVAEVIAEAAASGRPVYPLGGGIGLRYGVMPTRQGVGLSTAKLAGLVDYPTRDLTITVGAGMTVAELTKRLASHGQRLPVDIPQPSRATMGGAVAVNPHGARRLRWGSLRDYVIGLRAVDGRGTIFSGGGRVVKNAAGYDLCRLIIGSFGSLGVVTQVTLMIKPTPEASAWIACELPDWNTAERLLAELVATRTLPSAVELLAGPAWHDDPAFGALSPSGVARLAVGFEGTRSEVDWMCQTIRQEWKPLDVTPTTDIRGSAAGRLWDRLREFPADDPESDAPIPVTVAIRTPPSSVVSTVERILRLDPGCSIQAHAAAGLVWSRFSLPAEEVATALEGRLRSTIAESDGSMVVTAFPDGCRFDRSTIWGPKSDHAGVMHAIKSQFDPHDILNPGRFVF